MAVKYFISASKFGIKKRVYLSRGGKPTIWRSLAKRGFFWRGEFGMLRDWERKRRVELKIEGKSGEPDQVFKNEMEELIAEGESFGLKLQGSFQTNGGSHAPGSYHYQNKAVDWGDANNSLTDMRKYQGWAYRNPGKFVEFFFDRPHPTYGYFYIKNGRIVKGVFGGHSDHIHAARVW